MVNTNQIENFDTLTITDEIISDLLVCEKKIILPPSPKDKSHGLHKESGLEIESTDGKHRFCAFIREHTELLENFSIGLVYYRDKDSSLILVRYNGNHGAHKNFITGEQFAEGFHIHRTKLETIQNGFRPENNAELTKNYSTFREALVCFFKDLRIANYVEYFPDLSQAQLL